MVRASFKVEHCLKHCIREVRLTEQQAEGTTVGRRKNSVDGLSSARRLHAWSGLDWRSHGNAMWNIIATC